MRILQFLATSLALLLLAAASANAHVTITSSGAPDLITPGEEYAVDWTASANCAVVGPERVSVPEDVPEVGGTGFPEYVYGEELTFGIANSEDFAWLNGSEENQAFEESKCLDPANGGAHKFEGTLTFTVGPLAPAFTEFTFQPGAYGEANDGGTFAAEIAYNPAFTAPLAQTYNVVAGGATATIPLTLEANADSVFNFEVTSLTFIGGDAPEGAMAHIQPTLEAATGIFEESGVTRTSVDLHFGAGGDHNEGMEHMDEEHGDMDPGTADHTHWETAQASLSITVAAKEDATQVSEPHVVTLTFVNTDADTMPHVDQHGEPGDSNFLPGFETVGLLAALGAVALLRRRN